MTAVGKNSVQPPADQETIAVVLLNLGGPERVEDVRPFLYNLFSDRLIIRLGPAFLQRPLAWMIAKRRAQKSQGYYRQIGGGSPLNAITADQCRALETSLAAHAPFRVRMVMRYWHPFAAEVLPSLLAQGVNKLVALTLYPHYSIATTGSSLRDLREYLAGQESAVEILEIDSWPDNPAYIDCLAERIKECLYSNRPNCPCPGGDTVESPPLSPPANEGGGNLEVDGIEEVVYSAHSLPVKFIEEGDPYVDHLKRTIAAIESKTGKPGHLCFQSRSGPVQWLAPSTPDTIAKLAAQGCRRMILVPISFVSDHVETLCEIDIQYRELAASLGVELIRTRSLNTDPTFINSLKGLVISSCQAKGWL